MNISAFRIEQEAALAKDLLAGIKTYEQIRLEYQVSPNRICEIAKKYRIKRSVGKGSIAWKNKQAQKAV